MRQRVKERKCNLTRDQVEQSNATRRATYQKQVDEGSKDLEGKNDKLREWRSCSKEKGQLSAKRKATYASKKNTPCKESLALPRPDLASSTSKCPSSTYRAIPLSLSAEDDSYDGDPPRVMPNHIVGTNGMKMLLLRCYDHTQQPSSDMISSIDTFAMTIMQTTLMFSETASWAMSQCHSS